MGRRKWGVGGIIVLVCGCPSVRLSIYNVWVCVCVCEHFPLFVFLSMHECTSVGGSCLCRTAERSAAQRKCIKNYETARTVRRGRGPPSTTLHHPTQHGKQRTTHPKHPS